MNVCHKRVHPQTSKEDMHIVPFNSILEREVIRRLEVDSFTNDEAIVGKFVEFCNGKRLHSSIGYKTPERHQRKCMEK